MGYDFPTSVADLVDNSIEAGATQVMIDIEFEGDQSWVRIADNGAGMSPARLREALRYGSTREYAADDLGKFGLGLKVASLSQCQRLTVASRPGERAPPAAYCWDLEHIARTDRWELIPVTAGEATSALLAPLRKTTGTVVLWERLDRILGYESPQGESARRRLASMSRDVEGHLAVVFHRFLSGEAKGRPKLNLLLNGARIEPWDPFARSEPATRSLESVSIPVSHEGRRGHLTLEPYVLPHQQDFSSAESFRRASGPANWNQQQGFYVYRANRLIQTGGWCRLRTLDEHTKLARVALRFSPQLDEAFHVNVAKMRVQLPSGMREPITEAISAVTRLANDIYRRKTSPDGHTLVSAVREAVGRNGATQPAARGGLRPVDGIEDAVRSLLTVADAAEARIIRRVAGRLRKAVA
jgi:hypothetical protein